MQTKAGDEMTRRERQMTMQGDANTLKLTVVVDDDVATVLDEVEHWQARVADLTPALATTADEYRAGRYDDDPDERPLGAAYDALCARVSPIERHVRCGRCS